MSAAGERAERPDPAPGGDQPAPWWRCVVAALPLALVGLQFLMMARAGQSFLGASRELLTRMMQAEFLVLHSMAFLGLIALSRPKDAGGRRWRAVVFWGLFALYCVLAASRGTQSLAIFFGLTFVTYLGMFMNWNSQTALLQLGARWLVGLAVFLICLGVFGAPKNAGQWIGRASVVKAGAAYFLALAAIELSGFYLRYIPRRGEAILGALRKGKTARRS